MKNKKRTRTDEQLRDTVRRIREALGDTQEKFAQRIGVAVMTISRFETGRQVPRDLRVLVELYDAARAAGLEDDEAFLSGVMSEHRSSWVGFSKELLAKFTPAEWRLMQAARIAMRFYPEVARAIEEAATPTLALVDEILRGATTERQLTDGFYRELEELLDEVAERRSFDHLRKKRNT